jgi:hypothetical protein
MDADLVDRGRRIFEFLAAAQQLKSKPVRTVEGYGSADGIVQWLKDVPEHPAVVSAHRLREPAVETPLLVVNRVGAPDAPVPPAEVADWIEGPLDDPEMEPRLRDTRLNPRSVFADGSDAELNISDYPVVQSAFELWMPNWVAWAVQERTDRPVRALYRDLFAMYVKVTTHLEELELVLALGCLAWQPEGYPELRRHVLTCPAAISLEDVSGTITVSARPSVDALTLELDMVDPALQVMPAHIDEVRALAREFEPHPLHRAETGELIQRVVYSLDANGEFHDDDMPRSPTSKPVATFAPALIVRKRSQTGLVTIFQQIAAEIASTGAVPSGLLPLVDADFEPTTTSDPTAGASVVVDNEVFLPLPLNDVQLRILQRVDGHAQTIVQGPPGTGKTHMAAALITHLLAQGKRVLVTAHTDRALKEVRAKLPAAIRPLAVAVVGTDRSDMADLKVSVENISSRATDHDGHDAVSTEADCLAEIDRLRRERAAIHAKLMQARTDEVEPHSHAGYSGTLAQIAQRYQDQADEYAWIADFVTPPAGISAPVGDDEAVRLLDHLRDGYLLADEPESRQRVIDLAAIPMPDEFAAQLEAQSMALRHAETYSDLGAGDTLATIRGLPTEARSAMQARMRELSRKATELEQGHEAWMSQALRDIRSGRASTWEDRAQHVRQLIVDCRPLIELLGPLTQVHIENHADRGVIEALTGQLHAHVVASGALKLNGDGSPKVGAFTAKAVKEARPVFGSVRVNGRPPVTAEHLVAVLTYIQADRHLSALDKAWPADVAIPDEDTLRERLQWHATELGLLGRLLELGSELAVEEGRLAQVGLVKPDWNDTASVLTYATLVDAAAAQDAHELATKPLNDLEDLLETQAGWADAADTMHRLRLAVHSRSRDEYAAAHNRLVRLHAVRAQVADRDSLTARLRASAPELVDAVISSPSDPRWDRCAASFVEAWDWARTGAWVLEQDTVDTNVLQAQITAVESRIRRQVEMLAATRAWRHALAPTRLTGQSRADLTHYAQLVRGLGKGTGKYAAQRRAEIRTAMDRCRPAVPVWILPIYRIAEQLRVAQNMFDVVIVDEASQAGIEATFLQYLAPKIVVIGDDKQVSPAAVGVDQQQMRDLANIYLHDNRFKAAWQDPKRSFFDEANMRFGSKLTLVEHRRCVPEIIGFSNRIAYEPENIRLIPVRQFGADRLEPIKLVRLTDGYERGSTGSKTNPAEADAILAQLQKCLVDPRYDGLTFGV